DRLPSLRTDSITSTSTSRRTRPRRRSNKLPGEGHPQQRDIAALRSHDPVFQLGWDEKEVSGLESNSGAFQFTRHADDDCETTVRDDLALVPQVPFLNRE